MPGVELIETGALGVALLIIYALVDKVALPRFKAKQNGRGNGRGDEDTYSSSEGRRRLRLVEEDLKEHRDKMSDITEKIAELKGLVKETRSLLERVELDLRKK